MKAGKKKSNPGMSPRPFKVTGVAAGKWFQPLWTLMMGVAADLREEACPNVFASQVVMLAGLVMLVK